MSRQLLALIFPLLVAAAAHAGSIPFEDCGSLYSLIDVDIEGCNNGLETMCNLMVGTSKNFTFRFNSDFRADSLNPDVTITAFGLTQELNVSPRNCEALLFTTCPIESGQTHEYRAAVYINYELPRTVSSLTWRIFSEGSLLICMRTDVNLIGPGFP